MIEQNHEYYVSLEVAKLLKEAGFDWEVNHSYPDCESLDNSCSGYMEDLPFYHNLNDGKYGGMSAPTLDVAQRWLREEHGISVQAHNTLEPSYAESWITKWFYDIVFIEYDDERSIDCTLETNRYNTYEEAQEAGIKKVLEIMLEKGE